MALSRNVSAKLCFAFCFFLIISSSVKAQTSLTAGDIAFTGYKGHGASATVDEFSFVLLANITSGTVIHFTENAWTTDNVFRTGENTVTWTSNSALSAGQEIRISGTTATLASGPGSPGTVTGTALALSANGDQIIAYQSTTVGVPPFTFVTAIHMNVYNGAPDPSITTAAAWDALNVANSTANSCAIPTGLTTGVNAIWIGVQGDLTSEKDNAYFVCAGDLSTVASIKALIFDRTKWATSDNDPPGFSLPTGCSYVTAVPAPVFTLQPANTNVCEGANTSFTITATGATSYQWQVDQGGGFVNITNDATYSGATTTTLNVTAVTNAMNGFLYRCIATNGSGSTNSNNATLTVTPLPINPTLLAKTPATPTVADGVPVSATFNAGSGGTGCADDYRYTINGGTTYLPYTPGSNISTTGLAAAGGMVVIEGRRAGCSSLCQNSYVALASWVVTPLPAGATTLAAGDIGFSAYTAVDDQFSFVLLKNIGPGTVINFTENGWLSTNVFRTGENTVTWTSNAAYQAGTEININGLTATLAAGGSAGTVTGTALALAVNGDQIIAYQGSAASPTFISAIHMNVYDVANGDPVTTTAAAWDGTANTTNASALPTGLTTGVNAIWIGTQNDINSEFDNARFGNCAHPAVYGPINTLRAALNNQANWIRNNSTPPGFNVPTGCNYLNSLVPTITTTASFTPFVACTGTPSAEQTFTVSGTALTANIVVTAPTNFRVSLTSGAGYGTSVNLTPSGGTVNSTTIYIRTAGTALPGSLSGNVTCASAGATTITIPVSGTVYAIPNTYNVTGGGAACGVTGVPVGLSGSDLDVTYQLQINGVNTGSPVAGTGSPISFGSQTAAGTYTVIANQGTSCQQTMTGSAIVTIGPVMNAPTVTQPTHAVPTGTIVVNATAGPGQTLEYKIGSGAYQVSNTFSGLAPGLYNIFARVQGTNCESPYINNPVSIWAIGTRVSDNCLIYGTSPFQDSMWSVRISDYAIIDRLAPSLPGFTITGITGMATDPITAEVYVIMKLSGVTGRVLGKINLQTGVCTQVGNLGDNFASITFRSDGQLFGVTGNGAMVPETLYLIDKTNGNKTLAAALGAGADGEIICFNPDDNFIYHWSGNGTVVYEKVMSVSPYTTTNIPITGTTNGETFGAIYLGGGEFLTSNIASSFNKFTTTGTVTGPFGANPDDLRGLVKSGKVSSITAGGPTSICQVGGSVLLTVNGGTGSYQWYRNGITIPGENNATYTASTAGVYNCRYADVCGTIDSVAAGIIVSTLPDNTITLTSAAGTNNQTVLINTPITTITYATTGATGATFSGLPAGVTGIWNANTVTISGTPTVPGLFNYTVALTGGCGTVQATGSIDVIVCSITLTSAPGTNAQTVCQNTAITNITYATTGATGATVSGLPPGVTGTWAANVVTISGAPTAAGPFNYTVTPTGGGCNGSITATGTINVIPAPVITCPVNTTVAACQTQASVNAQFAAWLATASGSGGSNGVLTNNNTGAPSACGGSTTVTFTYTNDCAPTTITCQATFTVTAPPTVVLSCPVNTTVAACQTQAAVNAQFAAWLATASASGGCNGVLTNNNTGAPSACGGSTTVTFTYTSSCAPLTTTCTATFTVAAPPTVVLTCPVNTTVSSCQTQAAVNAQFAAWLATASATGGCNGVLTNNNTGAPPACGGSTTVTFTYTSSCAPTTTTCTATFTVPAPPPVIITCPAPVTVSCVAEVPAPDVTTVTVNSGCGVVVTHQGDVISGQTCVNRYTITRTYRATDVCGNFTECTQVITVNDQTPPVITCPAPVTVSCASAVPAPNTASVIATDNCGGVVTVIHVSDVISNQTCANRFTITRTYRATDVCGNFAECTQIITVNDQTPPTLTCPAPVTVSCASAVPAPNIALVTGVSDNCGGVVTVTHVSDVISNQTCANRYTITRTYRATDVCGNFAECTQIITVNDQTPPVITCPAPITVSCASAVPAPNIALVTATDNCAGAVTITHISDVISNQTCPNRFTLTRRYRATDVCGNFAECTQIITVNDQTAPVITCPSNITVTTPFGSCTAVVNFTVTATDNCGTVNIVSVPTSGSAFPIGTTTVTSTATDACGNTATCTFTITVLDGQLPVITAQPQNRTVCAGQNATFSVTAITSPNANGPLSYQWQSWNGSAWVNVSGATASTFTVSNTTVSQNTNSYRVLVIGLCTTVTSAHATLYVNPNPTVTIQTSRPPAILPTQTVNLIAVVTPGGGTYQWFKNNVAIPGSTGSGNALLNLTVDDAGTYRVRYTDPNGCVSTSADVVVSALASPGLWVFPNPNQGTFNVRYYNQTGEKTTVKVYNLLGQEVYSQSLPLGISYSTITVNLYRQPAGTYIVKVLNGNNVEIASRRIIVYHP